MSEPNQLDDIYYIVTSSHGTERQMSASRDEAERAAEQLRQFSAYRDIELAIRCFVPVRMPLVKTLIPKE